jgi:hypothetical protein
MLSQQLHQALEGGRVRYERVRFAHHAMEDRY